MRKVLVSFLLFVIGSVYAQRSVTFSGANTNFVTGNDVTVVKNSISNSSQSITCVNASNLSYLSLNGATSYLQFSLSLSTEKIDSIRIVWKSGATNQLIPILFAESITFGTYNSVTNVIQATNGGYRTTSAISASGGTNCTGGDTIRFPQSSTVKQVLIPRYMNIDAANFVSNTQYSLFPARLNNSTSTGYTTGVGTASTTIYIGSVTLFISNIPTGSPTITFTPVSPSLTFGNVVSSSTSSELSYSVSGSSLTNDITITPPSGYEISTGTGGSFVATNPITLSQSGGTVASTPIYVRFKPTAIQSYPGNIVHTSTGATQKDVAVSGSGIAPSAPTSLSISHRSDNIQRLTWTAPSGSYDQLLIFAREAGDVNHTPSGAGSAYNNANSSFGSAGIYSTDNRLVYAGTGTNVEITGLNNTTTYYYQAFAYSGNVYSTAASVNGATAVQPTTAFGASVASQQSALTWTNPTFNGSQANYWDEVIVLAKSGSAVDQTPGGDASIYSANAAFGSGTDIGSGNFVVYKGTGTGMTVTGLTNGITYHYATFVRHGNVWSVSQTASATPNLASNASDEFRSKASGNWNAVTPADVWQSFTNGSWIDATLTPGTSAASITIRTGHTITIPNGASITADDIVVEAPTSNVSNDHGRIEIASGGTFTVANGIAATDIVVNGYVKNSGTFTATGVMTVSSTGVYEDAQAATTGTVTIPTATWQTGSTCSLTGLVGVTATDFTTLQGVKQSFSNFHINISNMLGKLLLTRNGGATAPYMEIAGTLTIDATGSGNGVQLISSGNNNNTLAIGNFVQNGGFVAALHNASGAATRNVNITGDFTLNNNSVFDIGNTTGTNASNITSVNIGGNLTVSATATMQRTNQAGASGTVVNLVFNGLASQSVNFAGAFANTYLNVNVNKTSGILTLNSDFSISNTGAFNLLSGSVALAAGKAFNVSGSADFNGNAVTLKSDATGTASIGQVTGSLLDATNVTIERYIPAKRAWRLLTAPLKGSSNNSVYYNWQNNGSSGVVTNTGVEIWGSSGTGLATGANYSLRKYTSANGWVNITNTQTEQLFNSTHNNAFAIFVTGSYGGGNITSGSAATTLKATGTLHVGNVTHSNIDNSKHAMIGNPYASPVNIHNVISGNAVFDQFIWFWDPALGSNGTGGYVTYTVASKLYTASTNYPGGAQDAIAQSGQAFFIKANNPTNTLTFSESNKTTGSSNTVFRTRNTAEVLRTGLYKIINSNALLADAVMNIFTTGSDASVTNDDAVKMSNGGENLSIIRNNSYLSIEYRPTISSNDTIFLTMWNIAAGNYRFRFEAINMSSSGLSAFLEDAYLNTSSPVSLNGNTVEVDFTVTSNAATTGNRFRIVFRPTTTLPVAINNIKAFEKGNAIALEWSNSSEANVERYEVERSADGRNFTKAATITAKSNNGSAVNYQWIDNNPLGTTNYYRIKVLAAGDNRYSSIVKVNLQKGTTSISLYPNPVKGESVQLQLSNLAKGQYTITMYNSAGQQVYQRSLQHNGGSASETISLGNTLPSGSYVLRLTGSDIDLNQRIIIEKP